MARYVYKLYTVIIHVTIIVIISYMFLLTYVTEHLIPKSWLLLNNVLVDRSSACMSLDIISSTLLL